MVRAGAALWSSNDDEEKNLEAYKRNRDMTNDLEQPSNDSNDVVHSDLGGSDATPPGDSAVEAGENVPLPKEEIVAPKPATESSKPARRPRVVKKKPVVEERSDTPIEVVVDPMFFAGLNTTMKMMVQHERRQRLSSLAIV